MREIITLYLELDIEDVQVKFYLKFLEEVVLYVKNKQVSIHIPEGKSKIGNYVFDKIEMNYMLKLF